MQLCIGNQNRLQPEIKKTLQYWNKNQYEDRKKTSCNTKKKLRRQY